jgi:hypothetical protein
VHRGVKQPAGLVARHVQQLDADDLGLAVVEGSRHENRQHLGLGDDQGAQALGMFLGVEASTLLWRAKCSVPALDPGAGR